MSTRLFIPSGAVLDVDDPLNWDSPQSLGLSAMYRVFSGTPFYNLAKLRDLTFRRNVPSNGAFVGGATLSTMANPRGHGSMLFDGVDDEITIATTIGNRNGSEPLTVSAWIKPGRLGGQFQIMVGSVTSNQGLIDWMLYQHLDDGSVQLHGSAQNKSTYIPAVGVWVLITATVDSSGNYNLYANGQLVQTVASFTYFVSTAPNTITIGAGSQKYLGLIDDVRIYNRALSAAEVASIYRDPNAILNFQRRLVAVYIAAPPPPTPKETVNQPMIVWQDDLPTLTVAERFTTTGDGMNVVNSLSIPILVTLISEASIREFEGVTDLGRDPNIDKRVRRYIDAIAGSPLSGIVMLPEMKVAATSSWLLGRQNGDAAGVCRPVYLHGNLTLTVDEDDDATISLNEDITITSLTVISILATTFIGNLIGDVAGNVTGNLTGNVTGNVTGNLTGNVTGNVAGALTGTINVADTSSGTFYLVLSDVATGNATLKTDEGIGYDPGEGLNVTLSSDNAAGVFENTASAGGRAALYAEESGTGIVYGAYFCITQSTDNAAYALVAFGNGGASAYMQAVDFERGVAPDAPPAGALRFYALDSSGLLVYKNAAGTVFGGSRLIYGNAFDGSADLAQIIASTFGGTGNGFTKFTGPATSEKTFTLPNVSATILTDAVIVLRDEKAQNTAGGTFTSGAWQTRVLNTEASDTGAFCSLSANQFTLTAGTYEIRALCPAVLVDGHQARLYNVTGTAVILVGTTEFTASGGSGFQTRSIVEGKFTIAASQALEIQHQCTTTRATNGFGVQANFTTEVYTIVFLRKVG